MLARDSERQPETEENLENETALKASEETWRRDLLRNQEGTN